ncbi:Transcription factor, fungi [Penicillium italicum]|uniref:Transcription factor, fungi n=1 Tax=Penicillium italicum TaxID=40296 RepID=A0A0A2LPV4_PENIT|nr:Transcription factor, fungi [Penicillium italicum]
MTPTPPSTNSSSAGHSPDYRVVRKRNRVPLSCGPCRHRKLKCNRTNPCENCVKRGDAASCNYAQPNSRKKNPSQQLSNAPDDMQNRIDRLEGLVLSLMTNGSQSAGPTAAMAAISGDSSAGSTRFSHGIDVEEEGMEGTEDSDTDQVTKSFGVMKMDNNKSYYVSEAHWASVLNDISEVRSFFTTHKKQADEQFEKVKATRPASDGPGTTLLFGVNKAMSRSEIMTGLPSKYTTDILIARYFNCHDSATHVLHGPTFQAQYNKHWDDPGATELVWIAMLFGMMRLATLSYHREGDEPPEFQGKSLDMAGGFRNSVAQCLTLADYTKPHPFLIEALVFHLHGDFTQTREADISIWVMTGIVARLAMRSGYHRDSKMFPNITPFQGEMRRRVWTFVRQADLLFSYQVGLPGMIRGTDSDTELPRNLYDDDFNEECKELPPSRQLNEPTPISYLIAKARISYAFGHVVDQSSTVSSTPYEKVMEIDAELRQARDLIPDHLRIRPLEECQLDPVNLIMSRFFVMAVYNKAQCVLHRPYVVRARDNPRFTYSRRTCIDSAMELLQFQALLHAETRSGRLRSRHSRVSSLSSADFLLAATIVTLDLYHGLSLQVSGRPSGDTYTWGRERRDEMTAAIQLSKEIWDESLNESMEAWKASKILGLMLSKLRISAPGLENSAGAASFEPQDEKQNAAITLGLLSSGMSPMNPGPPPFADPMFKMGESPMGTGGVGVGASAEMPGALSPFSSMFGQMPDMQVNLDWDAWDTYIQNPTLDTTNQFWPMIDAQRQTVPQSGSMSQPSVSSPLASGRVSSVSGVPRPPTMFSASSNSPDSGGVPVTGYVLLLLYRMGRHCFRQAVSRLQLSPAASRSSVTAFSAVLRSTCPTPMLTAARFAYPTFTQTRLNSTDEGSTRIPVQYVEAIQPKESKADQIRLQRHERRRQVLSEGPTPKTTVYVGNLFFDVTAEDLRKHFEKFGAVENALIVHDSRGLSKGFGYVTYSTVEEATEAITQQHGGIFEGREVVVQFSNSTYRTALDGKPSKTLYIGNVPYELTDQDLQDLFDDVSGVTDVRIPVDRRTGLPRGFGHVDFADQTSASHAREVLARKAPYGRKLIVTFAKRKVMTPEDHQRHQQKRMEKMTSYNKRQSAQDDAESVEGVKEVGQQSFEQTETEQKQ